MLRILVAPWVLRLGLRWGAEGHISSGIYGELDASSASLELVNRQTLLNVRTDVRKFRCYIRVGAVDARSYDAGDRAHTT